jgi:hypothetical protein
LFFTTVAETRNESIPWTKKAPPNPQLPPPDAELPSNVELSILTAGV